jgi:DNA-binding NarL/FixJ family response regulator
VVNGKALGRVQLTEQPEQPEQPISVAIVDDHAAVRRGIELLLRKQGCRIAGRAGDAERGYELILARRPDVALIDMRLPGQSGTELTRRLLAEDPELGVVLYTGVEDERLLAEGLDSGARGFALKAGDPGELQAAVLTVAGGGTYVDPRLRPLLLSRSVTERVHVLSEREREILDLIARGLTGEQIAELLEIAPETVRTHIRNAMDKLETHTRAQAVAVALREGEISFGALGPER